MVKKGYANPNPTHSLTKKPLTYGMISFYNLKKYLKEKAHLIIGDVAPPEEIKAEIRKLKSDECPNSNCKCRRLHGNGWRPRYVIFDSEEEDKKVWYWRIECQGCGVTISFLPDIVMPDLYYHFETVCKVVSGRLSGQSSQSLLPSRSTQKRWLDRFKHWFPVAQACGVFRKTIEKCTQNVESVAKAVIESAQSHVGLFFPSHPIRRCNMTRKGDYCPAITTHQSCTSIFEVDLC